MSVFDPNHSNVIGSILSNSTTYHTLIVGQADGVEPGWYPMAFTLGTPGGRTARRNPCSRIRMNNLFAFRAIDAPSGDRGTSLVGATTAYVWISRIGFRSGVLSVPELRRWPRRSRGPRMDVRRFGGASHASRVEPSRERSLRLFVRSIFAFGARYVRHGRY